VIQAHASRIVTVMESLMMIAHLNAMEMNADPMGAKGAVEDACLEHPAIQENARRGIHWEQAGVAAD
jgi:hypothetical protein